MLAFDIRTDPKPSRFSIWRTTLRRKIARQSSPCDLCRDRLPTRTRAFDARQSAPDRGRASFRPRVPDL